MTVVDLYRKTVSRLQGAGIPDPDVEAGLLIGHFLNIKRFDIFLDPELQVTDPVLMQIEEGLKKRLKRVPLAYVLGEMDFWSRSFLVAPDVLIPRPETELLVEKVLARARGLSDFTSLNILDLGSGSGIIAITLALELPGSTLVSLDLSFEALKIARQNALKFKVLDRVHFINSDWHQAIGPSGLFDFIVSNPPYVAWEVMAGLQPELAHEPVMALDGGVKGTVEIARIFKGLDRLFKPEGRLFMEIGYDQRQYVTQQAAFANYQEVVVHNDYAGLPRILEARCGEPDRSHTISD